MLGVVMIQAEIASLVLLGVLIEELLMLILHVRVPQLRTQEEQRGKRACFLLLLGRMKKDWIAWTKAVRIIHLETDAFRQGQERSTNVIYAMTRLKGGLSRLWRHVDSTLTASWTGRVTRQ